MTHFQKGLARLQVALKKLDERYTALQDTAPEGRQVSDERVVEMVLASLDDAAHVRGLNWNAVKDQEVRALIDLIYELTG